MVVTTPAVTFLFTDIEGSTKLWERSPSQMRAVLARHDALLRKAIEGNRGNVFKTVGDGVCAAFSTAPEALAAAMSAQRALLSERWPEQIALTVRMALHTGIAEASGGDYFGPPLNRVARLLAIGHGRQILLSEATAATARAALPPGASLLDRGIHRLKDLQDPEKVFQLCHPELPTQFPPLRSLSTHPNNLPQQLTSFIGREKEIAEIKQLLAKTRLLTLTGSGGCGKTRLALQVAAEVLEAYPDGVWLVELASLSDPGLVPQTIATVFGLKEEPGKSLTQTLTDQLQSKHLLLVLDNAEHLLAICAQSADAVLRQCPRIGMLVTSREGLGMAGELTYRVPSLSMPDPKRDATPESLSQYESARLFIERAQFHRPQFAITQQNAPVLASVCSRLDGIPLAIELAAARVRSMSVEEVNQRLDQQFRLLTGGSRTALPRQQTLRSLIDWSYELLNDAEKVLLCRLSVFSGGWVLKAAEQVCSDQGIEDSEILDLLTSLADKSLIGVDEQHGVTRFRLLETVRQYARDRLMESGEIGRWRDRHLAYFLALAEEAEPHLRDADQQAWLDGLDTEHDNLRSALAWSSAAGGDTASGLRLASALWWFWNVRGHLTEGRSWLSGLLAAEPSSQFPAIRADALLGASVLAAQQDDYRVARALCEESLAICRGLGDQRGIARSLNNLGNLAHDEGDYSSARARYEECLAMLREQGDQRGIIGALSNLGNLARKQGDYAAARLLQEEGLAYFRKLGVRRGIAAWLHNLAGVDYDQGDNPSARAKWQESLALFRELGDRRNIAETLEGLADVAFALAEHSKAAHIWGAAQRLRKEIGAPLPPGERTRYNRQVVAARTAIDDDTAFNRAWQEGGAMTLQQAIEYALEKHDCE